MFPDGTGPALLSCLIGGIPLDRVHELQFRPGEIRCDVTYDAVNDMTSRPPPLSYFDALERGRVELRLLRENPDMLRNVKDLKYEEEREIEVKVLEEKKEEEEENRKELERLRKDDERMMQMEEGNTFQNLPLYPVLAGVAVVASSAFGGADETETIERGNTIKTDMDDQSSQSSTDSVIVTEADHNLLANYIMSEGLINEDDNASSSSDLNKYDADYDDLWLGAINEIIQSDNEGSQ